MPFKPVENPKCPLCKKSVYAAEERSAGNQKYHKMCFKCMLCNKMLELTNFTPHEDGNEIYCRQCHGRKFGPKGVGFGVGAGCMSTDSGAQFNNTNRWYYDQPVDYYNGSVPINDGYFITYPSSRPTTPGPTSLSRPTTPGPVSYSRPTTPGPGNPGWVRRWGDGYHYLPMGYQPQYAPWTQRSLTSEPQVYSTSDGSSGAYSDKWGNSAYSYESSSYRNMYDSGYRGSPSVYGYGGRADRSVERGHLPGVSSSRRVFSGDEQLTNSLYDPAARQKAVDTLTVSIPSNQYQTVPVYNAASSLPAVSPRPLYNTRFYHSRGYGKAIGADNCPRCHRAVYAAERRLSQGAAYHRECFTCRSCRTSLDSTNCCDANGEIWCKICYNRFFGIKGVGFGIGAGILTTRK